MQISNFRPGSVYHWLDQGPAVLLAECELETMPVLIVEGKTEYEVETERGWVISLLQTGEILTVHEETLNLGDAKK
jgi:hypothetical protein